VHLRQDASGLLLTGATTITERNYKTSRCFVSGGLRGILMQPDLAADRMQQLCRIVAYPIFKDDLHGLDVRYFG